MVKISKHSTLDYLLRCGQQALELKCTTLIISSFTRGKDSNVETVKNLIKKSYSFLILRDIKNYTYKCSM
jgi:hypothetical protein